MGKKLIVDLWVILRNGNLDLKLQRKEEESAL